MLIAYIARLHAAGADQHTIGALQQHFVSLPRRSSCSTTSPRSRRRPDAIDIGRARGDSRSSRRFSYTGRRGHAARTSRFELAPARGSRSSARPAPARRTLLSLLLRFYDPQPGASCSTASTSATCSSQSLRAQISSCCRSRCCSPASIAENIRYGRLDATWTRSSAAAKAANAHDFIRRCRTATRPRSASAARSSPAASASASRSRARSCKDAPILILDEPTSSIDSKTEAVILDALERLMGAAPPSSIAHRLSTIRDADLILVLEPRRAGRAGHARRAGRAGGLYASCTRPRRAGGKIEAESRRRRRAGDSERGAGARRVATADALRNARRRSSRATAPTGRRRATPAVGEPPAPRSLRWRPPAVRQPRRRAPAQKPQADGHSRRRTVIRPS